MEFNLLVLIDIHRLDAKEVFYIILIYRKIII